MKNKYQKNKTDFGEEILDKLEDAIRSMDFSGIAGSIQESVEYVKEEAEKGYSTYKKKYQYKKKVVNPGVDTRRETREKPVVSPTPTVFRTIPGRYSSVIWIILGIIGMILFGGLSFGFGIWGLIGTLAGSGFPTGALIGESIYLPFTFLSGIILGKGIFSKRRVKRLKKYESILKGESFMMLSDFESKSEETPKVVQKDIQYIMKKNLIPRLSMDQRETCLLLTEEARRQYQDAENARLAREREKEAWEEASYEEKREMEFIKETMEFLDQLAVKKEEIFSEEMAKKTESTEVVLSRLFVCVKEHPEYISRTDRLRSYYMPLILKLLGAYTDLEKQPIQGDNIQVTKKKIEDSFDTINEALTNMFDDLFQGVALDISSDIQVLHSMLAQDGLKQDSWKLHSENNDFSMY